MTTLWVEGIPAPQGSKNAYVRGGRAVLVESSKKVPAWRNAVAKAAFEKFQQPLDGPVELHVEFVMPRTKAMRKNPAPPMVQKPDLDKLIRSTCDGLTGPAVADDSRIVAIVANKRRAEFGEQTGAHITIEVLA